MPDTPTATVDPTIVLLTDFGLSDPYVGQMKGVLRALAPRAAVIDLSHGVPTYRVETGAFFLVSAYAYFPAGAVFVAVVDPWVGTERDILILRGSGYTFVGPDNGILSLLLDSPGISSREAPRVWRLNTPPAVHAREMGLTFAGRDIMAPLAARLCRGADPAEGGEPVDPADLARPI